jgi:hypothetical protein
VKWEYCIIVVFANMAIGLEGKRMRQSLRARFWFECVLSTITGIATVATLVYPDWIEALTGMDPDHGNGSAEWAMTVALAVITVGALVAARIEWRRGRVTAAARAS